MKRLFLLLAAVGLFTTACQKSEENGSNGDGGTSQKIVLSQTKKIVANTAGEYQITITSPCSWDALSKNNWIIVKSEIGNAGSEELRFSVAANESDEVRKGTIVVYNTYYNLASELIVVQAANGQSLEELEEEENKNDGNSGTGGDNDGGNTGGSNNSGAGDKRLAKMVAVYEHGYDITIYSYDNQGRLIKSTSIWEYMLNEGNSAESTRDGVTNTCDTQYEWSDSAIKVVEIDEGNTTTSTFTLNNGLVQSFSSVSESRNSTNSYNYNAGRPVSVESCDSHMGYSSTSTSYYTWDGDKLTLVELSDGSRKILFTYSGTCKKGYNPLVAWWVVVDNPALVCANPDVFGVRTNQLITTACDIYNTPDSAEIDELTYSYELNNEGYISKVTMQDSEGVTTVYTLTWE